MNDDVKMPWWRSPTKLPFVTFLAIAGYFLWAEHQAHVIRYLPWLLVLGCAGMHFLMHRAHGQDADSEGGNNPWHGGERKQ